MGTELCALSLSAFLVLLAPQSFLHRALSSFSAADPGLVFQASLTSAQVLLPGSQASLSSLLLEGHSLLTLAAIMFAPGGIDQVNSALCGNKTLTGVKHEEGWRMKCFLAVLSGDGSGSKVRQVREDGRPTAAEDGAGPTSQTEGRPVPCRPPRKRPALRHLRVPPAAGKRPPVTCQLISIHLVIVGILTARWCFLPVPPPSGPVQAVWLAGSKHPQLHR